MDAVKRLFQVNEIDVQRCVPLFALFQNLAQSEDVIRAEFAFTKSIFLKTMMIQTGADVVSSFLLSSTISWQQWHSEG